MTPSTASERVLCLPAAAVDRLGPPPAGGFTRDWRPYFDLLRDDMCRFVPRGECEEDEGWRQVIPYIFLESDGGVLAYKRMSSGGESRLHNRFSIGVGGHVNDSDLAPGNTNFEFAVFECVWREIYEEVYLGERDLGDLSKFGVIDSCEAKVDRVHLGFVHRLRINGRDIRMNDNSPSVWGTPAEHLASGRPWENWSRIVLGAMAGTGMGMGEAAVAGTTGEPRL